MANLSFSEMIVLRRGGAKNNTHLVSVDGCEVLIHLVNGVPLWGEKSRSWAQSHAWMQIYSRNSSSGSGCTRRLGVWTASEARNGRGSGPDANASERPPPLFKCRCAGAQLELELQNRFPRETSSILQLGRPEWAGRRPEDTSAEQTS